MPTLKVQRSIFVLFCFGLGLGLTARVGFPSLASRMVISTSKKQGLNGEGILYLHHLVSNSWLSLCVSVCVLSVLGRWEQERQALMVKLDKPNLRTASCHFNVKTLRAREFPDGPVVRTLRFHCQRCRFNPCSGRELRSHKSCGVAKKKKKILRAKREVDIKKIRKDQMPGNLRNCTLT